jgi:di/tricarboxylate transporter
MNSQTLLTLVIVGAALVLFWSERISAEVVALGVVLALVFTGLLPADTAFAGFGSGTVIMILGLLILTAALQRTGVVDIAGRAVLQYSGDHPDRLLLVIMITSAAVSAFISNTASTALFIPIVFGIAAKARISASKLLMPLAFSSILSSSVTVISTSTNLVISGMLTAYGMKPLSMFELAPVGVPIAVTGLVYMFYIGRRLIPERQAPGEMTEEFGVRPYLAEVVIQPGSSLAGKTLEETRIGRTMGFNVLRVIRGSDHYLEALPGTVLQQGDVLLIEARQEDIVKVKDTAGIEIKADVRLSDPDLQDEETALAEAIVLPGSPLIGRTLKTTGFRDRYALQVLGLNHRGVNVVQKLSEVRIRLGDVLLLQGRRDRLARLHHDPAFHVLGPMEALTELRPRRRRAGLAIGIFAGVITLAALNVLPLAIAVMLGALLVFLTRCVMPEEAYDAIEWKAVILVGCMLGLGVAMEKTGTAAWLARIIAAQNPGANPVLLLGGFFILTVLLTQPMSNQTAAIVVMPVAIQTALRLGLNPRSFAVMIAVAASCSYITPLEPACLMVYGPGRYRFMDFLKVGSLLTGIIFLIAIVLVPYFWPLAAQP